MRWSLFLEKFSPELILANAFSRLDKIDNLNKYSTNSNSNKVEST